MSGLGMTRRRFCAAAATGVARAAGGKPAWRLQHFHDEDRSALTLVDLAMASPQRGVAVGMLAGEGRPKPTSLVTANGGDSWEPVELPEAPRSLFFRSESLGWLVTGRGVWRTTEAGRSWQKLGRVDGLLRVHFVTDQRGWGVGERRGVYATTDGGARWTPIAAIAKAAGKSDRMTFECIEFRDERNGMIVGFSRPDRPDRPELPPWADPEEAMRTREWPGTLLKLETHDGGQSWTAAATSAFGRIVRLHLGAADGLALMRFEDAFQWPSELYRLDMQKGASERVFHPKDTILTDMLARADGTTLVAGVRKTSVLNRQLIPGEVQVLRSRNLRDWEEMAVDYRASARAVRLSGGTDGPVWLATDGGMILRWDGA